MSITILPVWSETGIISAPDAPKISVGWQVGDQPPEDWLNWLFNSYCTKINEIIPEVNDATRNIEDWFTKLGGVVGTDLMLDLLQNAKALGANAIEDASLGDSKISDVSLGKLTAGNAVIPDGLGSTLSMNPSQGYSIANANSAVTMTTGSGFVISNLSEPNDALKIENSPTSGAPVIYLKDDSITNIETSLKGDGLQVDSISTNQFTKVSLAGFKAEADNGTNGYLTAGNLNCDGQTLNSQLSWRGVKFDGADDIASDNTPFYRNAVVSLTTVNGDWSVEAETDNTGTLKMIGISGASIVFNMPLEIRVFQAVMTYQDRQTTPQTHVVPLTLDHVRSSGTSYVANVDGYFASGTAVGDETHLPEAGTEEVFIIYDGASTP